MSRIGFIGGSGLSHFDELVVREKRECLTHWGKPSSLLMVGSFMGGGQERTASGVLPEVVFIARHGENHQFPPHKVNYRANMAALKDAQVSAIYAVNVVGGINREMSPGDLVIPDQVIDYTWGREHTYFDGSEVGGMPLQHVDFTYPYDDSLRKELLHQAIALGLQVHSGGVYGATQGPRLESAAEISRLHQDGCDIVGMTGMPEAALARELGLPYASLCLVVNLAAGLSDEEITLPQIQRIMDEKMTDVRRLLMAVVRSCEF